MLSKKAKNNVKKFRLSDDALNFIKKYVIQEMNILVAIDEKIMDKIIELSTMWEEDMIDMTTENYQDKTYNYPNKERNIAADKFVAEITGQWDDDKLIPDFDDLNMRLGLKK